MRSLGRLALLALMSALPMGSSFAQDPGTLETVVGGGDQEGEDIPAVDLALTVPVGVSVDSAGNIYVADMFNHRIRRVDAATGRATTVAGTGEPRFAGDGGPATEATLNEPQGVTVDASGNIYIGDSGNRRVRRLDVETGIISTIAGTGETGESGDGGPAAEATFDEIVEVLAGDNGGLYVAEGIGASQRGTINRVRRIDLSTGTIATVAGNGSALFSGDGVPATDTGVAPRGLALDGKGNLYIADFNNHRVRKVDATTSTISTIAGRGPANSFTGEGAYSGDGGPATEAFLNIPCGVAVDSAGTLYIADLLNQRVRVVEAATGNILTVAGTGELGFSGDGGLALEALLNQPTRVALDPEGDLLIADRNNDRIRRLAGPTFRTPLFVAISEEVDFGEVSLGNPVLRSVRLENRGNRDLTVESAIPDNPEFTVEVPLPLQIGPVQAGEVSVRFNPTQEGILEALLTLTTNDPRRPDASIRLKGFGAVPVIGVLPDTLQFERTLIGEEQTLTLRISNLGKGVLVLSRVTVTDTQFVIDLPDTLLIPSSQFSTLSVTFRPTVPDTQRATLTLVNNDPDNPSFPVPIEGVSKVAKPGGFADVGGELGMGDSGAGFGVAWGDYDNDGDPDLYVVRSMEANLLYRNDGDGFQEVAASLGVADDGDGSGAAWADFDDDGYLDLYVTNYAQPNLLYRNDGDRFEDVAGAMVVDDAGDGYGAAWADFDRDGDPDLYVANFGPNRFYRNDGDGFVEVAESIGVAGTVGLGDPDSTVQPVWGDYDNDGDQDLYLVTSGVNRLFRNDDGRFADATKAAGLTEDGPSFGAGWGDYDNDGDLDLYVASFGKANHLYRNDGGLFKDVTLQVGVGHEGRGRGAVWGDFDNDGDLDLYVTNSGEPNILYRNDGSRFSEVAEDLGVDLDADSRGVALADFDEDGGLDLYVAVQNGVDRLYRNQEANGNWLVIRPTGTESSRDAIGARFAIAYDNGEHAVREITGGSSYLSQDALEAAFGIDKAGWVDTLTIWWPTGVVQRRLSIPANKVLEITEEKPLPPSRIVLEADVQSLVANGQAQTDIRATVVDSRNEATLVTNLSLAFRIETGKGFFVGPDTVLTREGRASVRFRAGITPGTAVVSAVAKGLKTGRVVLDLLAPLESETLTIRTVAGLGIDIGVDGDGGPALEARLNLPRAVAVDSSGNLYIADTNNQRIRRVDAATGIIETLAGDGVNTSSGDNGPASEAQVADPRGVALFPNGDLLISEQGGHVARRIFAVNDTIVALAGRGISGFGGDGRAAVQANLSGPVGVATDRQGNAYIADQFNNRIRRVDPDGVITTVAGSAQQTRLGDGGRATSAFLSRPQGVTADSLGRLFIADTSNHRIRMVDTEGIITTVVGTGEADFGGDGGPGALARVKNPRDVAVDGSGHLFISDSGNHCIRVFDLNTGLIQTVAGTGFPEFTQDEGQALQTGLSDPSGLAVGPTGTVLIADNGNGRIRELTAIFPEPPPANGEKEADFNEDGQVDYVDFIMFAGAFGSIDPRFDLDGNGQVGFTDFIRFALAFERERSLSRPGVPGRWNR